MLELRCQAGLWLGNDAWVTIGLYAAKQVRGKEMMFGLHLCCVVLWA